MFRVDAVAKGAAYYEVVAARLRAQVLASAFWQSLAARMGDFEAEYRMATDFDLRVGGFPDVLAKDWERFLDKTYRRNVQDNLEWPRPPNGGWLIPPYWFSAVNDVVRTLFVVKYLDGVDYFGSKIDETARDHGLRCVPTLEYTELGYYAGHVVVSMELEIPLESWSIEVRSVSFEIQVTTQVQEVIRRLLHPHYESHQLGEAAGRPWQWDYESAQFSANYLGHILHYVEGQIMKVREDND